MAFFHIFFANSFTRVMLCCILLLSIAGPPIAATAADTAQAEIQSIVQESMEDLWNGREFSPELIQRQQTLKTMLSTGAVTKNDLERMVEASLFSITDHFQTTRYNLKRASKRVNAIFSPHMDWPAVRALMWRVLSSAIKKDAPVQINVGTLAPPGTPWITLPETIVFPDLAKLTDGKLLFKIYSGGVVGDDADILKKIEGRQIDGCGCTALGVLAASPETSALLVPGLFKNYEEVDFILEKFRPRLDKAFEEKGYLLVALIDTGFLHIFSKNKITGLADLKSQKIVQWFGAMESALYQELGIDAKPLPVPEIVSALSMGQADAVLLPSVWVLGMQAYQYANFYLNPPFLYSPGAVFVSSHTSERLQKQIGVSDTFSRNLQEMMIYEFNVMEPEWKRQLRNYEEKSLKAFEAKGGMKAITFSAEDQQIIQKAGKAVQQKMAGKVYPKDLIDEIEKALVEYRATH
jgi:TRAP-type transport system periplasmic protein